MNFGQPGNLNARTLLVCFAQIDGETFEMRRHWSFLQNKDHGWPTSCQSSVLYWIERLQGSTLTTNLWHSTTFELWGLKAKFHRDCTSDWPSSRLSERQVAWPRQIIKRECVCSRTSNCRPKKCFVQRPLLLYKTATQWNPNSHR